MSDEIDRVRRVVGRTGDIRREVLTALTTVDGVLHLFLEPDRHEHPFRVVYVRVREGELEVRLRGHERSTLAMLGVPDDDALPSVIDLVDFDGA